MTDLERLEKFKHLKEMINGPEAEEFKNYWDGRFFTGDMTFIFDKTPYNMYFYKGTMIDVQIGPVSYTHLDVYKRQHQDGIKHHGEKHQNTRGQCPPQFSQVIPGDTLANKCTGNGLKHGFHKAWEGSDAGNDI